MICAICRAAVEGVWNPADANRIGLLKNFPSILELLHRNLREDDKYEAGSDESRLSEPEHYVFGHHTTYESLLQSKANGCVVCNEFSDVNDADDVNPIFKALGYYSVFIIQFESVQDELRPTVTIYSGEPIQQFFHDLIPHTASDGINTVISPSTGDSKTWSMVQRWFDRCMEGHLLCRSQGFQDFMPTRLLKLCTVNDQPYFELIDTGTCDVSGQYITLSHCWGSQHDSKKLRLLRRNEDLLRAGMPIAKLPKTFKEAFEIVSRFGVRYLWIDRLCIIQQDALDWGKEASMMHMVYRNGLLNIAALGSSSDEDGCFFPRNPLAVAPSVVHLHHEDEGVALPYLFAEETSAWKMSLRGQPLLSRAWVLQERLLAPRVLYFGSHQVFWECCEANCCETHPSTGLVGRRATTILSAPLEPIHPRNFLWKLLLDGADRSSNLVASSVASVLSHWGMVVNVYTKLDLTKSYDKLVALSGLAKHVSRKLDQLESGTGVYLAGIWKTTLPGGLLWEPEHRARQPADYRAPSWSWASLDGAMKSAPQRLTSPIYTIIEECEVVAKSGDVTAEVIQGRLVVTAPIASARVVLPKNSWKNPKDVGVIQSFHDVSTGMILSAEYEKASVTFDSNSAIRDDVFVLPITSMPISGFSWIQIRGLALARIHFLSRLCYQRVGTVIIYVRGTSAAEKAVEKLLAALCRQTITIF